MPLIRPSVRTGAPSPEGEGLSGCCTEKASPAGGSCRRSRLMRGKAIEAESRAFPPLSGSEAEAAQEQKRIAFEANSTMFP